VKLVGSGLVFYQKLGFFFPVPLYWDPASKNTILEAQSVSQSRYSETFWKICICEKLIKILKAQMT